MSNDSLTPAKLLNFYFRLKSLKNIYQDKFRLSTIKGTDRLSGMQFSKQSKAQIRVAHKKVLLGTYNFSPYLELLQSKGRGNYPRIIAIPTIRDRIVLYALKEILSRIFQECVPRRLANTYIHNIQEFIKDNEHSEIAIFRTDIKTFYDSIDRDKLLTKLKTRIKSGKLISLIKKAIETPVVPKNYHKTDIYKYKKASHDKGIPQGISISNILASIYLYEFDQEIIANDHVNVYYRYVDDILVFTQLENLDKVEKLIKKEIENLNLKLNEGKDKTFKGKAQEEFEYLGYKFELPKITIKSSSIEKFISSIAAKFSAYIHNRDKKMIELKKNNYDIEKLKEIFVIDLNEKITGAINENRKYGWIFYFNAINDISILYRIDNIIAEFFKRLEDFEKTPPQTLKKISRAFYEARYNPTGGYIHNYNEYQSVEQKIDFLKQRARLEPGKQYSKQEIEELYENLKSKNLLKLEKDDALLY